MSEGINDSEKRYPWKHTCAWRLSSNCQKEWVTMKNTPQTEFNSHGICPPCKEIWLKDLDKDKK